MRNRVDQKGASAEGDIIGGSKTETHIHLSSGKAGKIEQLLKKLEAEVEQNAQVRHTLESLQRYYTRRSYDGVDGLEAKLKNAGRGHECMDAIEKKELFAKMLERWSLYASAQSIFAHLLAHAEYEFTYFIHPQLPQLDELHINELVHQRIVEPTIQECGSSVFALDHSVVMGMIYWLAEQCYVRWHK